MVLGVLFNENRRKNHIRLTENKISKSLGILHPTKFLSTRNVGKMFIFFFIHSCIKYCDTAWGSTKLKKIFTYRKKATKVSQSCSCQTIDD